MSKTVQRTRWVIGALVFVIVGAGAYTLAPHFRAHPKQLSSSQVVSGSQDASRLASDPSIDNAASIEFASSNPSPTGGIPVRFDRPVDLRSIQQDTLAVLGPEGSVPVTWAIADVGKALLLT